MSESLKSVLIKGNRYIDAVNMLYEIVNSTSNDFPLHHPYIDENNVTHWRVNGEEVRKQASLLLSLLDNDSCGDTDEDFTHLMAYLNSELEVYMINYAVAMSHNHTPENDIEVVRRWSILSNLVNCWGAINRDMPWYIPEHWCKERD